MREMPHRHAERRHAASNCCSSSPDRIRTGATAWEGGAAHQRIGLLTCSFAASRVRPSWSRARMGYMPAARPVRSCCETGP
jgi:hypothetical protein